MHRRITLYDLTGIDVLKNFETKATKTKPESENAAEILKLYESLDDEDYRKKAIDTLLGITPNEEGKDG